MRTRLGLGPDVYPLCVGCGQPVPWSLIYYRGGKWACACCTPDADGARVH